MVELSNQIGGITESAIRDLEKEIRKYLDKCGMFYKLFSRIKDVNSCEKKINNRVEAKGIKDYRMQDLIGFRTVLYFKEDVELCKQIIRTFFDVVDISEDDEQQDVFGPVRINFVCRIKKSYNVDIDFSTLEYFDDTFELQLRTVFSEGWHEIEHDFRYKTEDKWKSYPEENRIMNGIFATLETCDWAIASLFDSLAYQHYKDKKWQDMLNMKLRIRMEESTDFESMQFLDELFCADSELAKSFFKVDRYDLLLQMANMRTSLPKQLPYIVQIINYLYIENIKISEYFANDMLAQLFEHAQ